MPMNLSHHQHQQLRSPSPPPPLPSALSVASMLLLQRRLPSLQPMRSCMPPPAPPSPRTPSPLSTARSSRVRPAAAWSLSAPLGPLLPVCGPWGVWAALLAAGTLGLWSERFRLGKELSGALVATLAGMFLANTGVLPPDPPELQVVYKYILPLAIPMLLFSANLWRIVKETGRLLPAFLLGSMTTAAGTLLAFRLMPLGRFLQEDGWKVASALTARHIGGAVNYMAVTDSLAVSPSIFGAGLAADDLILTLYFTTIYTMAKSIPPDPVELTGQPASSSSSSSEERSKSSGSSSAGGAAPPSSSPPDSSVAGGSAGAGGHHAAAAKPIEIQHGLTSLAISACVCYAGFCLSHYLNIPGQFITLVTGLTVILATLMPKQLAPLVVSAQGMAQILMQVFYATIGASANVGLVLRTAPILFGFSFVALTGHLVLLLVIGRFLGFSKRDLLLASNANIGGPSTVAGMASAKGWTSSLVPGILTSTLGYAIGSFIGIGLGHGVLKKIT